MNSPETTKDNGRFLFLISCAWSFLIFARVVHSAIKNIDGTQSAERSASEDRQSSVMQHCSTGGARYSQQHGGTVACRTGQEQVPASGSYILTGVLLIN